MKGTKFMVFHYGFFVILAAALPSAAAAAAVAALPFVAAALPSGFHDLPGLHHNTIETPFRKKVLGFTMVLINVDSPRSPLYNPNISNEEKFVRQLNRSVERSRYLQQLQSSEDPMATIGADGFQYFIEVHIGTPPIAYDLLVDTGSPLTWVNGRHCDSCKSILKFDPEDSDTSESMYCSNPNCNPKLAYMFCYLSRYCMYEIHYGDGSNSTGEIYEDAFTFSSVSGKRVQLEGVQFGVAGTLYTKTLSRSFHGIFGLDKGARSFLAQGNFERFAYCLPTVLSEGSSKLHFGSDVSTLGKSTPLLPDSHFIISLEGININEKRLNYSTSGKGLSLAVDTGTVLTNIRRSFFNKIVKQLLDVIELERVPDVSNHGLLCFEGGDDEIKWYTPYITLHFKDLDLEIAPNSAFMVMNVYSFCLMIQPIDEGPNILGAYFQENLHMSFDIKESKLHMHPMTCATIY